MSDDERPEGGPDSEPRRGEKDKRPSDDLESPLNVARKWVPWCAALIFAMTIGWTALIAWEEIASGRHEGIRQTAIAIGSGAAPATPLIVIYAIMIVSTLDLLGGFIMVTARYLTNKFLKPMLEKQKAEAERREAEVRAEALAQERRLWTEWNRRRMDAEASGAPFDEPPPAS